MKTILFFFLSAACLPSVYAAPAPLCNQNGDLIYLQQERGDAPRIHDTATVQRKTECGMTAQFTDSRSSAASNVQPADAACPQSVLAATPLSIPKLSVADAYASLIATGTPFSVEPAILEGNSLEERDLW